MEFEQHFAKDEVESFEIDGGKFVYKPVTAGEESKWLPEYIIVVDGKIKQDYEMLNRCKLRNLISVPYSKELISKLLGTDNLDWKGLSSDLRWKLISKLTPSTFDKIMNNIKRINAGDKKKD